MARRSWKKWVFGLVLVLAAGGLAAWWFLPGYLLEWGIDRERTASRLTRKTITVDDHQIAYLEGGQGETIVLVHGFGGNKDNWTRFARHLTLHARVIALDLPGFGESTYLPEASYDYPDQARRLDRFVQALGLARFHLAGNSMGGNISGRYAVLYPDKVVTLGLFNAGGVRSPKLSELEQRIAQGQPNPLIVNSPEDLDRLLAFIFVKPPYIPGFARKLLVEEGRRHHESNQRIFKEISADRFGLEPDLGRIRARTLVLWGDTDRLIDVSAVPIFAAGIPGAKTVVLKECGHAPMVERPEETAGEYLAFLKGS
jgi:pimeloyl-ACP methyl ester carboxylesterase